LLILLYFFQIYYHKKTGYRCRSLVEIEEYEKHGAGKVKKDKEKSNNKTKNETKVFIPVNESLPPGKKFFEAKITENLSEGYTIETVIDEKSLRGILFLNKPNSLYSTAHTSRGKRTVGEIDSVVSNGILPNQLKTPKVLKQNQMENQEAFRGDNLESREHRTKSIAVLMSSNPVTANASYAHEVSANPELEAFETLNRNDEKHETPKSLIGNLKKYGANDVTSSKGEVQLNDQTKVRVISLVGKGQGQFKSNLTGKWILVENKDEDDPKVCLLN